MQKTTIPWTDFSLNPVKGLCPMGCPYCYARKFYKRGLNEIFKNQEVRYEPDVLLELFKIPSGSRVFVGSTIELFGPWVKAEWMRDIFDAVDYFENLTFIFLTKQPQLLPQKFPENCWVGVSVTANGELPLAWYGLNHVQAGKRFISFEPLHGRIGFNDQVSMKGWVDWVIIGLQTPYSLKTAPRSEWIREIVDAADNAEIPVFLKDNLKPILEPTHLKGYEPTIFWEAPELLRQEFPTKKHPEKQGVVYLQSQV